MALSSAFGRAIGGGEGRRDGAAAQQRGTRTSKKQKTKPYLGRESCYNRTMHWLARLVIIVGGNALALWAAYLWVPGFVLGGNWITLILIALVLAILNFFLKPLLTLVLGPIIILTLGLGVLIVNGIILYLLPIIADHIDFLRGSITIQDVPPLHYFGTLIVATLIISIINFIIHLAV
jgi:uncharacterized membrane protein YvlD (DUF360 family)